MYKTKIRILLTACAGGLIGLMSFMRIAHAETHIIDSYINNGEYWSASSSPYIIETTVNVDSDKTLTIGPGVSIIVSPELEGYDTFYIQGRLIMKGEEDHRIRMSGQGSINISGGTTTVSYADIYFSNGLNVYNGDVSISNSNISSAYNGLWILSSKVNIKNSRIDNNNIGIYIDSSSNDIFQVKENLNYGHGGIGNALFAMNESRPSEVIITNSSISNNTYNAIKNNDTKSVNAVNNWWGSEYGPSTVGENKVSGLTEYAPWLSEDPWLIKDKQNCCSNILFIPGLEGSRLYKEELWPILGTTTNTLWEPNRNADVEKLYLNADGSSKDLNVYSGEPIDKALGFFDIYSQFMNHLNDLSKNGIINKWKAFGYDWRKPIAEVVAGKEIRSAIRQPAKRMAESITTESLIDTVIALASSSQTGKVTLIAHSNGGLVSKYLVKSLMDIGKESLIDSVISVAVPYLGTPQAIASLLHGDGQSIAGGLILKDSTARNLGINMASAYSLLPSMEYFKKVFSPTIVFAATTTAGINDGSYPQKISNHSEQSEFISDVNNVRIIPPSVETYRPIKGNQILMAAADIIHGILDPFSWPASISRWAIFGWGLKTTEGVLYSEKTYCIHGTVSLECGKGPTFTTSKTIMGDGTVITPSAAYNAGTAVALELPKIADVENKKIDHSNILEASSTLSAVDAIVTHNPADDKQDIIDNLKQIPGVTIGEPDYNSGALSYLKMSTHSPVELHVYDSKGNHTGLITKPVGLEDVEEGLYSFYEEKIAGSTFESAGGSDEDPEYQIYLPDDNGEKYSIVLNGTGLGMFTFDIDRIENGKTVDNVEYAYMPVNPLTIATTTVLAKMSNNTSSLKLASTSPILNIDVDGNGSADIKTTPKTQFDPLIYLESMKTTVSTLAGNLSKGKNIIKRIDKIENLIKQGKIKKTNKAIANLDKRVGKMKLKELSENDKQKILDMIDLFVSQYE